MYGYNLRRASGNSHETRVEAIEGDQVFFLVSLISRRLVRSRIVDAISHVIRDNYLWTPMRATDQSL